MIRVMVIEDEPPILRSICHKVEHTNPHFQVVATAGNGQEGIDGINDTKELDLIFVDINLPVINGIGVLDYVRQNRPEIMTVVLSGYKDFEYVKRAYERKTVDYLLKPLKDEELKNLLERIESAWTQKRAYCKVRALEEALHSPAGGEEELSCMKQEQCKPEEKRYFMIMVTLGSYYNSMLGNGTNYTKAISELALEEKLGEVFPADSHWLVDGKSELDRIIFIDTDQVNPLKKLERIYSRLQSGSVPVTMTINTTGTEAGEVYATYYEMRKYVEEHMIFGKSALLIYEGGDIEPVFCKEKARVDKALSSCKGMPDIKKIRMEITTILEECIKNPTRQNAVLYMVKRFFSVLCGSIPCNSEYVRVEEEIEFIILNGNSYEQMKEQIELLVDKCFGMVKAAVKDKEKLAGEMKQFLEANYSFGISNQMMAEKFGFVPTYLSSIFKEYYGISLGDYLIRLRIEEAKELLLHSSLKIKEIAEKTGYSDALYFSKAFKKAVGVSPKEFICLDKEETIR